MKYYNNILIFDVETNGLIPKGKSPPIETLPYILQLSFIVYNPKLRCVTKSANHYIKVDDHIDISADITRLTGIDRITVNNKGVHITHALKDFYESYMNCDCIVAHNIYFDRKMMQTEFERNLASLQQLGCISAKNIFEKEFQLRNNIENFCTMNYGKAVCKIERTAENGEKYYKPPKLVELYQHLFHNIPENLHNSMIDTIVCFKCFAKMKLKQDLSNIPFTVIKTTPKA